MKQTFDNDITEMAEELSRLSASSRTAVFACSATRLARLYAAFAANWAPATQLTFDGALDEIWATLQAGESHVALAVNAADLEALVPHSDDSDDILAPAAQDAAVMLQAAREELVGEAVDSLVIEYAVAGIAALVSHELTGYAALGDDATEEEERALSSDERLRRAVRFVRSDISELLRWESTGLAPDWRWLRGRAVEQAWTVDLLRDPGRPGGAAAVASGRVPGTP